MNILKKGYDIWKHIDKTNVRINGTDLADDYDWIEYEFDSQIICKEKGFELNKGFGYDYGIHVTVPIEYLKEEDNDKILDFWIKSRFLQSDTLYSTKCKYEFNLTLNEVDITILIKEYKIEGNIWNN